MRRVSRGAVVAAVLVLLGLAGLAGVAVVRAAAAPSSLNARAHQLEQSLRCPTCDAESVAASNAPIAQSMRSQVRRQLTRGRTDEQVRAWFVRRYGSGIWLDPGGADSDLLLVMVPVLVLGAGVTGLVLINRRRRPAPDRLRGPTASRALSTSRVLVAGGTCLAVGVAVPLLVGLSPGTQGSGSAGRASAATSSAPATASASRGADPARQEEVAFDLLKQGQPAAAERMVRAMRHPRKRPLALLVLGLAQRARHEPVAHRTLEQFVHRFPHHRATPQVRRLLRSAP